MDADPQAGPGEKPGETGKKLAKKSDKNKKLTPKEKLFCDYYTGKAKFNGFKSAKLAGFGKKDGSIAVHACKLLKKPKIKAEISRLTEQRFADRGLSTDRTINEVLDIAFCDVSGFLEIDCNGYVKWKGNIEDLPTAAIQEVHVKNERTTTLGGKDGPKTEIESWVTRIKFHDKKWALDILARLLDMKSADKETILRVVYGNPDQVEKTTS